ncbi:MAG: type II secretion system F family protein [Planctomycetes bacterium]|nr:type II secretion system F family protein [Planctomycetota bacterium]
MALLGLGSNTLMLVLLVAGPLIAFYGVYQLVADLRSAPKRKVMGRLKGQMSRGGAEAQRFNFEDLRKEAPKAVGVLGQMFTRLSFTERLQTTLEQANVRWSASRLLGNLTLLACILLAAMIALKLPILAALGAVVAVYVLPILYLGYRRKKRLNKLVLQLPDVFELLGQALRAGHSLASGMQVVATEMPEPAGTEFGRVFHEQNLGLKIEDALRNLAERTDMLDVRLFVTAILIQRQTGGDLAEVLDKISDVIRDRIKLHGTVLALTAEGRLSGSVLLALPFVVFLAMLKINYEYAELLWSHPTGQMMSMFAIVSMIMGWVMIKKIINIKI